MASFVSSRDIEATKNLKKQEKREARNIILKQAEQDHEKRKRQTEVSKRRGEDTWIAPGVMRRFTNEEPKRKRKRCHKKKSKKRSKRTESSSDASSQSDEDMWVEKGQEDSIQPLTTVEPPTVNKEPLKRDSWMTVPLDPIGTLKETAKKNETEIKQKEVCHCCLLCFMCHIIEHPPLLRFLPVRVDVRDSYCIMIHCTIPLLLLTIAQKML